MGGIHASARLDIPSRARTEPAYPGSRPGFTLVELMIVLAILATLATLVVPMYVRALQTAKVTLAAREIEQLQMKVDLYEMNTGALPKDLAELGEGGLTDPWGNPYQYLNFGTVKGKGKGKQRKDKFLVPLNSKYDLYSMGKDGKSQSPLTAKASRDDIVRANDGDFVGLAADY